MTGGMVDIQGYPSAILVAGHHKSPTTRVEGEAYALAYALRVVHISRSF